MRAALRMGLVFAGLELAVMGAAWACSCAPITDPPEALLESHALVVFAEVKAVRSGALGCGGGNGMLKVHLEVIEGFKGAKEGQVVVLQTHQDGATCGQDFAEGESWLVYSLDGESDNLCSPSRPADADDSELERLRELVQ